MSVASFNRTLDQELAAIARGASFECLVCGEFLLHRADGIGCPQCGLELPSDQKMQREVVAAERLTDASSL